MPNIEIRPANAADLLSFYGKPSAKTVRAFCISKNGEVGAIAGITISPEIITFFSDMKDGVEVPKMTVWRVSKEIVRRVRKMNLPIYAIENCNKPTAKRFLERLGFVFYAEDNGEQQYRLT